jgi:GNAT superfamily N-acetyltransferase
MDLPMPSFGPPSQIPTADASVRSARPEDAPGMGRVQAAAWQASYAGVLPSDLLDRLDPTELAEVWRAALADPPTRSHRVLVALASGEVVGFAATGPSEGSEGNHLPAPGEVLALLVDPAARHQGHGSRLLNAAADRLRESGFDDAVVWVSEGDEARRDFLTAAGFAADGGTRTLELPGEGVRPGTLREQRFAASLAPPA